MKHIKEDKNKMIPMYMIVKYPTKDQAKEDQEI